MLTEAMQAWRSATLVGSTGTAFTLALQTSVTQVGGVVAPQLFQSKWAGNGYKNSFIICTACVAGAIVTNGWLQFVTAQSEREVHRVRRLRITAEREGRVYAGRDVDTSRLAVPARSDKKAAEDV